MDKSNIPRETGRGVMGRRVVASYCSSFLKSEMLHIYRQVKALRGVDTFVVTKEVQNAERFPFENIEVIPKRRTNLLVHGWLKFVERRPPIVYRGEYQTLDSLLRRHGADLMHIYFGHTGVHLLPFIEQWHKPCVVSFHGADVALGEFPFAHREPPQDGKWKVVQACRLIPKKGVATSLRAFAIFKKDYPGAELFIAGKGPLQSELEMLAGGLGIARDVHFLGFLSQSKLRGLYGSSHLFLHPSEISPNQDQEGVPNSVLEAMATGLPVVATRHGGIPEAVDHGRTGFLVSEEDHVALANAMQLIGSSPILLKQMGALAHVTVKERFEQETQIEHLESFYEEAITMNGAAERVDARPVARIAPRFAEGLPAK